MGAMAMRTVKGNWDLEKREREYARSEHSKIRSSETRASQIIICDLAA